MKAIQHILTELDFSANKLFCTKQNKLEEILEKDGESYLTYVIVEYGESKCGKGARELLKNSPHFDSSCTTSIGRSYLVPAGYTGVEFMEGIQ